MAIKRWHFGKIVLLWVWGVVLTFILLTLLESVDHPALGFVVIAAIAGIPLVLSVVTWSWLGGREGDEE